MRFIIFFILGIIFTLCVAGYILNKNGMTDFVIDSLLSKPAPLVTEEFCIERGHEVNERELDGKIIKVCYFSNGGWSEIED